jgi:proteasome accessory factor B
MAEKIERLFNLIALLLDARRPVTAAQVRARIPGYEGSDTAFHRMFERDKAELRELGYVLEQEETADGEPGYRVAKDEALLGDIALDPAEMAALAIAAQAWTGRADGALALLKLSVGSGLGDAAAPAWRPPRIDVDERVSALFDAVMRRKRIRFSYSTAGGAAAERDVDPYAIRHRGGWYITGFDRERGDVRHFRLSRVRGAIHVEKGAATDFDPPAEVPEPWRGPWSTDSEASARVSFAPHVAFWAERQTGATIVDERSDGWVELVMHVADMEAFAAWIAGFGAAAIVRAPDELRGLVIEHLRSIVEASA